MKACLKEYTCDLSLNNDEVIYDYIDYVYRQIDFSRGFSGSDNSGY